MGRQTIAGARETGFPPVPTPSLRRPVAPRRPGAASKGRRRATPRPAEATLAASLERLAGSFGLAELGDDPLLFPRRYARREDREVVALFSALLAYGRVAQIRAALERIFAAVGPSPAEALRRGWRPGPELAGWKHRFNDLRDVTALAAAVGETLRLEGSLEALFLRFDDGGADLLAPLCGFAATLRERAERQPTSPGFRFLVSDPALGGASKRWNLFLRWVVRPGPIDLAAWGSVDRSRLTLPMDAHVARISRYLALTGRRTNDWKAAREATSALARIDPHDPTRFDFALCRLGVVAICRAKPEASLCARCPVADCCPVPGGGNRPRRSPRAPSRSRPS